MMGSQYFKQFTTKHHAAFVGAVLTGLFALLVAIATGVFGLLSGSGGSNSKKVANGDTATPAPPFTINVRPVQIQTVTQTNAPFPSPTTALATPKPADSTPRQPGTTPPPGTSPQAPTHMSGDDFMRLPPSWQDEANRPPSYKK